MGFSSFRQYWKVSPPFSTEIAFGTDAFARHIRIRSIRYRRRSITVTKPTREIVVVPCVRNVRGLLTVFFPKDLSRFFGSHLFAPPPRARRSLFSTCRRSAPVSRGRCKLYAGQPVILYFVINSRRGKFCFTHTRISYYLNAELMNGERSPQVRAVCCIQGGGSFGTLFKSSCVRVGGLIPPTTFCVSNARTGKWSSLVFETDAFKYVLIAL